MNVGLSSVAFQGTHRFACRDQDEQDTLQWGMEVAKYEMKEEGISDAEDIDISKVLTPKGYRVDVVTPRPKNEDFEFLYRGVTIAETEDNLDPGKAKWLRDNLIKRLKAGLTQEVYAEMEAKERARKEQLEGKLRVNGRTFDDYRVPRRPEGKLRVDV